MGWVEPKDEHECVVAQLDVTATSEVVDDLTRLTAVVDRAQDGLTSFDDSAATTAIYPLSLHDAVPV